MTMPSIILLARTNKKANWYLCFLHNMPYPIPWQENLSGINVSS